MTDELPATDALRPTRWTPTPPWRTGSAGARVPLTMTAQRPTKPLKTTAGRPIEQRREAAAAGLRPSGPTRSACGTLKA